MTKLGFQLYSARNFPPLSDILKKLSAAGYSHVEGFGGIYANMDEAALKGLRADLDANGLTMPTGHFGLDMLENDREQSLKVAKTLGIEAIYCPYLMPDQRPSDAAGWFALGKRLQEAGKPYRDAGISFGWHNHDFEFATLEDGSTPQEQILAVALIWSGKPISPGLSVAMPILLPGSKAMASASPQSTSRTLHRPAKTRMKTAGRMSGTAPSTGRVLSRP